MNWREVTVRVNREAGEAVANILQELGAGGVVLKEDGDRIGLTAYYYDNREFAKLLSRIKKRTDNLKNYGLKTGEVELSTVLTRDQDWATSWHRFFKPLTIGERFIICPSWEVCNKGERIIIKIDPGMAFGVGSHETSQMSIELLEKYINSDITSMLDIGTGTGILSIVAAKLGVREVLGVDIDPAAVAAARENVRLNQVGERVKILKGDLSRDVSGNYSLIVANLLPDLIQRLLPSIPELMAESGLLVLSGIIQDKKELIISQLAELKLAVIDEVNLNEWVSLVARKG